MANYIGRNGYPQPEIVAIATGKPSASAATTANVTAVAAIAAAATTAAAAADCYGVEFDGVLQQRPSVMSVVDLTNLDTIVEAVDDSVEM